MKERGATLDSGGRQGTVRDGAWARGVDDGVVEGVQDVAAQPKDVKGFVDARVQTRTPPSPGPLRSTPAP